MLLSHSQVPTLRFLIPTLYLPFPPAAPDTTTSEGKLALLRCFKQALSDWRDLLQRFLRSEDDQVGGPNGGIGDSEALTNLDTRSVGGERWDRGSGRGRVGRERWAERTDRRLGRLSSTAAGDPSGAHIRPRCAAFRMRTGLYFFRVGKAAACRHGSIASQILLFPPSHAALTLLTVT